MRGWGMIPFIGAVSVGSPVVPDKLYSDFFVVGVVRVSRIGLREPVMVSPRWLVCLIGRR